MKRVDCKDNSISVHHLIDQTLHMCTLCIRSDILQLDMLRKTHTSLAACIHAVPLHKKTDHVNALCTLRTQSLMKQGIAMLLAEFEKQCTTAVHAQLHWSSVAVPTSLK